MHQAMGNSGVLDFENIWGLVTNQRAAETQHTGLIHDYHTSATYLTSVDRLNTPSVTLAQLWQAQNMRQQLVPSSLVRMLGYQGGAPSTGHAYDWPSNGPQMDSWNRINEHPSEILRTELQHFLVHGTLMDHETRKEYLQPLMSGVRHTTEHLPTWEYALHYVDMYRVAVRCDLPELEKAVLKKLQDKDIRMPDVNKGLKRTNTSNDASNMEWTESNIFQDEGLGSLSTNWINEYATLPSRPFLNTPYVQPTIVRGVQTTSEELPQARAGLDGALYAAQAKLRADAERLAQASSGNCPAAVDASPFQRMGASRLAELQAFQDKVGHGPQPIGNNDSDMYNALQPERAQRATLRAEIARLSAENATIRAEIATIRAEHQATKAELKVAREDIEELQSEESRLQAELRRATTSITSHSVMYQLIDNVYGAELPKSFVDHHWPESDGNVYLAELVLSHHANKITQLNHEELQLLRDDYPGFHDDLYHWLFKAKADYEEVVDDGAGNWMVRLKGGAKGKAKAKL